MRSTFFCIVVFLLTSCAASTRDWKSTDVPGKLQASFSYFNGKNRQEVSLTKDEKLFVHYSISATSGSIRLVVKRGKEELWQKQFTGQPDVADFEVTAPEDGKYVVVVSGEKAAGSYDARFGAGK